MSAALEVAPVEYRRSRLCALLPNAKTCQRSWKFGSRPAQIFFGQLSLLRPCRVGPWDFGKTSGLTQANPSPAMNSEGEETEEPKLPSCTILLPMTAAWQNLQKWTGRGVTCIYPRCYNANTTTPQLPWTDWAGAWQASPQFSVGQLPTASVCFAPFKVFRSCKRGRAALPP
jgi:hypothetical protein